eukprot:SAG31_NODE_12926_length_906_cov_0.863693_1_plen_52_part_10
MQITFEKCFALSGRYKRLRLSKPRSHSCNSATLKREVMWVGMSVYSNSGWLS